MKADRTRKMILEKAAPLFNRKGFAGTSLADLEKVTRLTKGALYGNFADKDTLAQEAFSYAIGIVKGSMKRRVEPVPTSKGKLMALLDFFGMYVMAPPVPGGCPLLNAAVEADDFRPAMRQLVSAEIHQVIDYIASLIRKGMRAGEFQKGINPRELACMFFCALEGAIMFARVDGSAAPMKIIVNYCKNKLEQISNPLWNKNG